MEKEKIIKKYLSQKVQEYNFALGVTYLLCEVEYTDGSVAQVVETRSTKNECIILSTREVQHG